VPEKNNSDERDIPVPDPTVLTTRNLQREIQSLKELVFVRIECVEQEMRAAYKEHRESFNYNVEQQVLHLKELVLQRFLTSDEKFEGIKTQFKERDTRTEQTARDSKVAIDAALSAQEKAVGKQNESFGLSIAKSEASTIKQIDQNAQLLGTTTAGLNDKIDDIKSRLTLIEGQDRGGSEASVTAATAATATAAATAAAAAEAALSRRSSSTNILGIVGLIIGSIIGIGGIIAAIISHVVK
jgi:hypothetical protein